MYGGDVILVSTEKDAFDDVQRRETGLSKLERDRIRAHLYCAFGANAEGAAEV
jgi:hypothetical protein